MTAPRFRIMGGPSVPWSLVEPYEDQAKANHDQLLAELNRRGGLSPGELWCIVHGKRWREQPDEVTALAWLNAWLDEHETRLAINECDALRARVAELERELSIHRALKMIEPKTMSYGDASEFSRLKQADVAQGKRVAELMAERDRLDRMCDDAIEERDALVKQIEAIADALGDESEWSNLNDRGDAALESAHAVIQDRDLARQQLEAVRGEVERMSGELKMYRDHMARHFPGRGSQIGDMTAAEELAYDAEMDKLEKIKLDLSDPETRAVWEAVQLARAEVASWPAWKRGEPTKSTHPKGGEGNP